MVTVTLDPAMIVATIDRLRERIQQRFPKSGLERVCASLGEAARQSAAETAYIQAPNLLLRAGVAIVLALSVFLVIAASRSMELNPGAPRALEIVQGVDASINVLLLAAAGVAFLLTLESRLKRRRAVTALQEVRGLIHVIDMHQLTKDPGMIGGARTSASPDRDMTPFEMQRYLDYCSEMLSLAAKIAALYAQAARDSQVEESVSDIERLASNLSQQVWQKITILPADENA
jgi:hypothetical protein